jgi:hypothetical protein
MTIRCPACRTRRASYQSMQAHLAATGHTLCRCGGYHFAHRPTGGCCELNTWGTLRQAQRRGDSLGVQMDIAADVAYDAPGKPMKEWR